MNTSAQMGLVWKWTEVWRLFSPEEQLSACRDLLTDLAEDDDSPWVTVKLLGNIAKASKFRKAEVERLQAQDRDKLAGMLRARASVVLDETTWKRMFAAYYLGRKSALICEFLDVLGLEHNGSGAVSEDIQAPTAESVAEATAALSRTYTPAEIGRYLAVLARHDSDLWGSVVDDRDRLLGARSEVPITPEAVESVAKVSDKFNVLDRVMINEIVRSVARVEGCLREQELVELVETVLRMNQHWYRAYFHLGFLDVLLPTRELQFDRPEANDMRRGWYLAGVITGLARSHAVERLVDVLSGNAEDFNRAATNSGGPGQAIAESGFRFLVEAGRMGEALKVLEGQLTHVGARLGSEALEVATRFIRGAQFAAARQIIDILRKHPIRADEDDDDEAMDVTIYGLDIERRLGQCLQAEGNFDGAERAFKSLQKAGEDKNSPDLLADLGLVKGKFKSLAEVRLPEMPGQRVTLKDALTKGEPLYLNAVGLFSTGTPKACYALAILDYLRWTGMGDGSQKEGQRDKAVQRVQDALAAIHVSDFEHVYRDLGALGQCQFMLAVLKMSSLEPIDGLEAIAAWRGITGASGRFPKKDVRTLLDAATDHDTHMAVEIAESIWSYRKEDAVDILRDGIWISRSPLLMKEILGLAKSVETPRAERVRLWCSVIPALNRSNEIRAAEEGLEDLEVLAEDQTLVQPILEFVSEPKNIDPAWTAAEAAWARVQLMRRLGRDMDCALVLRDLFFAARDSNPWEAAQVLAAMDDWRLDSETRRELAALLPQKVSSAPAGIEERLASGERVRLLYVGGNEVQAKSDTEVKNEIRAQWPGVEVVFEHSAWASNWGRDVNRLVGLANGSDAVVLLYLMRTMLGRTLRERLERPWIACTSTGKGGMLSSIRRAAIVAMEGRLKRGQ